MKDSRIPEKIHRNVHVLYVAGPDSQVNKNYQAIRAMQEPKNNQNVNEILKEELHKINAQIPQMQLHQVNVQFSFKPDKQRVDQIRCNRVIISPVSLDDRYFTTERFISDYPKLTHLVVMTPEKSRAPKWPKINCFIEKLDIEIMKYVIADIMLDISMVHSLAALEGERMNENCDKIRNIVDQYKRSLIESLPASHNKFYFSNVTLSDYVSFAWLCREKNTKQLDVGKYIELWRKCCKGAVNHVVKNRCFLLSTHKRKKNLSARKLEKTLGSLQEGEYMLVMLEKACKTTEQTKTICGIFNTSTPKLNQWLIVPRREGEIIAAIRGITHLVSTYPISIKKEEVI